ncbi:DUF4162 domain-containing protein [Acidobacteria bacterium ACD]|nr:DUF4162 domain-containing protein [Acidobacteria bacterium ACD]
MAERGDSVLRAITNDGAFRVVVAKTTRTVRGVFEAQHAGGPTAQPFGDLITGSVLFRETMAPNLRVQGVLKGVGGRGSLVADSHPSGMTRGLIQLPEGQDAVDTGDGALLQLMRTLPGGRINQGVVEMPPGGDVSRALMAYMQTSEQVVSMVAVGTLLDDAGIYAAGGYLVQLLPEVGRGPLMVMTERLRDFENIDAQLRDAAFSPEWLLEQLLFLAEVRGRDPGSVRKAAERWLSRFELWDKRDAKLEELSKGNQQKVQLIGALLHDPELVLLDEPMSGLDPVNVILVRDLLAELKGEGKTILLSTHMMGEAERSVDEIVLIHGGKVVLSGDLAEVKGRGGRESVHLQFDGDGAFLSTMPGVARASVNTNAAELTLSPDADLRALLREAAERLAVRRFEVAAPTLEELFVEAVGGETLARSREGAGAGSPEVLS